MAFEPGNSYNAAVINVAKTRGQCVFSELGTDLRKAKINQQVGSCDAPDMLCKIGRFIQKGYVIQIDVIQAAINETTAARRSAPIKSGDEFDTIDIRLQALALLMLHYCSGLTVGGGQYGNDPLLVCRTASSAKTPNRMVIRALALSLTLRSYRTKQKLSLTAVVSKPINHKRTLRTLRSFSTALLSSLCQIVCISCFFTNL